MFVNILFVSENIYEKTYHEQIKSGYKNVPILETSPFKSINQSRINYLEKSSLYRISELVEVFKNPN
jgi:hypothetical protein